ncbi:asparagine synthase-related protein [Sphingobium sp. YR768]|uniref:asparagine synthase-related protein n=1 Tax=Sphingobium sp. YR768 TaxID=1884365 RepID=UPI0008C3A8E3|nr:asparagine synthetase B family protein [Sphingobium sp. YR768]SES06581.1 asparagine synthase (glutamine-hydrolysing) [Sphingobium sp. YR768]
MTMSRYLILAFGQIEECEQILRQVAANTALSEVYRGDHIIIFAESPENILPLPTGGGAIVGTLFSGRQTSGKVAQFEENETIEVIRDPVRSLRDDYWGAYVAIIDRSREVKILRDPTGALPCYYTTRGEMIACASDISTLIGAGLVRPSVNWRSVGKSLYHVQLPSEETGLSGINQLQGGCMLTIGTEGIKQTLFWSPWDYVATDRHANSEQCAADLFQLVSSTIKTWASCYSHPLVGLSGGLDSSIVAECLARAGIEVTCVTAVTNDPAGDERVYARQVCTAIEANLIEAIYLEADINISESTAANIPIPSGKSHEQAYNKIVRDAAASTGADSFFVGAGGDNVFYSTHSARPLIDRYEDQGLSTALMQTVRDICQITGANIWEVITEALRISRKFAPGLPWQVAETYLHQDFLNSVREDPIEHPWFSPPESMPAGKKGHVAQILRALHHIEHRDKNLSIPMISPLLSQPVMEFCLSVPSWWVVEGGCDRAIARKAFSKRLPRAILRRQGKGGPDGFVAQFIQGHRRSIADRLVDGQLSANGLLDRNAIETALRSGGHIAPSDCPRIMALLDAEAWVRSWSTA